MSGDVSGKECPLKVEVWSDVVCPWCYVGKRHLEEALARFRHADQVSVEWRSFELNPTSPPRVGLTMGQILQRKYGMSEDQAEAANRRMTELAARVGLEYHLDRVQAGNTFDAHRLIHLAATHGLGDAMKERLFAAYFTEGGRSVTAAWPRWRLDIGLDPSEVESMLAGDAFAADVRDDESRAAATGGERSPVLRHRRCDRRFPGPNRPRCCSRRCNGRGRSPTRSPWPVTATRVASGEGCADGTSAIS